MSIQSSHDFHPAMKFSSQLNFAYIFSHTLRSGLKSVAEEIQLLCNHNKLLLMYIPIRQATMLSITQSIYLYSQDALAFITAPDTYQEFGNSKNLQQILVAFDGILARSSEIKAITLTLLGDTKRTTAINPSTALNPLTLQAIRAIMANSDFISERCTKSQEGLKLFEKHFWPHLEFTLDDSATFGAPFQPFS